MNDLVYKLDAFLVIHLFVPAFSNCCQNFLILLTFSMNSESILNILLQRTFGNMAHLYIVHSLRPIAPLYTNTSCPPYASTPLLPHRPVCAVNNESLRLSNLGGQSILEPKQSKQSSRQLNLLHQNTLFFGPAPFDMFQNVLHTWMNS